MHLGSIDDSLPKLLHIPVSDWLRVGQPGGKYLRSEKLLIILLLLLINNIKSTYMLASYPGLSVFVNVAR